MSDAYTESITRIKKLINDRPWLFRKVPNLTLAEYVGYFSKLIKEDMFYFPHGLPLRPEVLEKYKEKIYSSYYLTIQSGMLFHTLVQLSPSKHIIFMWGNNPTNTETVLYATLYTSNPEDFIDFMKEHDDYVLKNEVPIGGFNFAKK